MRAIWKGHVRFSLVTIPIRIYSAIDTGKSISFNQLSKKTHNPVGYDKQDKVTGESLKNDEIIKGYQYEPGQFVIVDKEDIDNIKIKSTKVIEIEGFVEATEIHQTLYDTPYYLGPDGEVAAKTYALLLKTLKDTGKIGVGRVVLRDRESIVLLSPYSNGLVLYKLRNPEELRDINKVPNLEEVDKVDANEDQLKMAKTLVDTMLKPFNKIDTTDHYYEALRELIDAKIEGKEVISVVEDEPEVVDIMTALKKSIEQAKAEKKPMKKATGKKQEGGKTKKAG